MPEDYGKWVLSIKEVLVLLLLVLTGGTAVGWLFFDSLSVGAAAGVLCLFFLPKYKNWRIDKRRRELLLQFRDLLYSAASSVSVGRSMTQALEESLTFWKGMYDENDLIILEVRNMLKRITVSNENDVEVLKDFARRSGLPDVADFVSVYECCKSSGANLVQAINRAATVIGDRIELEKALRFAGQYDEKILVEEFIHGREIEVAVMGNENPVASICGEIDSGSEFYDYDSKYITDTSTAYIPARIPENVAEQVREAAVKVYTAIGCHGLSRVDFFVTYEDERVVFNEINTLPGFTSISMYPKLFAASGIPYNQLIDELLQLAQEAFA